MLKHLRYAVAAVICGLLAVSACGSDDSASTATEGPERTTTTVHRDTTTTEKPTTDLEDAFEAAKTFAIVEKYTMEGTRVVDEGMGLVSDGNSLATNIPAVAVVLTYLEAPETVIARMDNTTSLQGVQTAEWGNFVATWSYHPDNGFDITIEDTSY